MPLFPQEIKSNVPSTSVTGEMLNVYLCHFLSCDMSTDNLQPLPLLLLLCFPSPSFKISCSTPFLHPQPQLHVKLLPWNKRASVFCCFFFFNPQTAFLFLVVVGIFIQLKTLLHKSTEILALVFSPTISISCSTVSFSFSPFSPLPSLAVAIKKRQASFLLIHYYSSIFETHLCQWKLHVDAYPFVVAA